MDTVHIDLKGDIDEVEKPNINLDEKPVIEIEDFKEDRYSTLKLIPWWEQKLLKKTKIMVVGAGALGNEILKNLALLGIGHIFIVDMDTIENSNLTRSVLYRSKDEGKSKAQVATEMVKEINPDVDVRCFDGNVVYDLGLGVFRDMDIVIGGLDNREARLAINQNCWKVNKPWIDGAIEVLHGFVRVFVPPVGPCYECTMSEMDYKLLNLRRSCALLTRKQMLEGKVPTTPTTASVIAGIQVQEAIKLIHNRDDLPVLKGKGFVFNGLNHDSYIVEYPIKEDCLSHETYESIIELDKSVEDTTIRELLSIIKEELDENAVIDINHELVYEFICNCGNKKSIYKLLGKITEDEAKCSVCSEIMNFESTHTISGHEKYLDLTLRQIGIPYFDIITGRSGLNMKHFEFTKDKKISIPGW